MEGGERRLYAFVIVLIVLSYSRHLFFRFFHDARLPSFLAGHTEARAFFKGVAKAELYANLKSVVLERQGEAVRYHPRFLELTDHLTPLPP